MDYCCEEVRSLVEDQETPFEYDPKVREYSIVQKPEAFREKNELTTGYRIAYCPHCGAKYPEDLRDEWFDIIEQKFGINGMLDEKMNQLPEEFTTEEWWKNRGL